MNLRTTTISQRFSFLLLDSRILNQNWRNVKAVRAWASTEVADRLGLWWLYLYIAKTKIQIIWSYFNYCSLPQCSFTGILLVIWVSAMATYLTLVPPRGPRTYPTTLTPGLSFRSESTQSCNVFIDLFLKAETFKSEIHIDPLSTRGLWQLEAIDQEI